MQIQPDVVEKIRKLMERTQENGCTRAEAEQAFRMASRLLAEHNLSVDDVKLMAGDWGMEDVRDVSRWDLECDLSFAIVQAHCFVQGYMDEDEGSRRKTLMFFGKKENVAAARFVFAGLMDSYGRLWRAHRAATGCPASERRMFVSGVARGFRDKLDDERKAMEYEHDILSGREGGTALALANIAALTRSRFHEYNRARGVRTTAHHANVSSVKGTPGTLAAGYQAGRSLNLAREVDASGARALPGA